jgi:hypothetical protein
MFPLPRGSWCTRHGPEDNITRIGRPESQSTRLQIPKMKCATIVPKQLQAYAVSQNDHVNVYVLRSCAVLLRWSLFVRVMRQLRTMDATTTTSKDSGNINFMSVDIQLET